MSAEERVGVKTLEVMLMNFETDGILDYDETVKALQSHNNPRHQFKLG